VASFDNGAVFGAVLRLWDNPERSGTPVATVVHTRSATMPSLRHVYGLASAGSDTSAVGWMDSTLARKNVPELHQNLGNEEILMDEEKTLLASFAYAYDNNGLKIGENRAYGENTENYAYVYDNIGQLIAVHGAVERTYTYDNLGNRTRLWENVGGVVREENYSCDAANQLYRITRSDNSVTTITYDNNENETDCLENLTIKFTNGPGATDFYPKNTAEVIF